MTSSSPAQNGNWGNLRALWERGWFKGLLLVIAVVFAYQPAWHGGFIWDDDMHVTKPGLRSLDGLARIWVQLGATQQYYPLVHSVFWVEHRLWGDATLGYHLVNILLHAFSALLLARILRQLKVPGAWLAAALYALHPVQVESVAWISELKNTLSGVFYLSAALAYLGFDRSRSGGKYALALGFFVLGLMSKSAMATLPAALLVVLWWQRGKLSWRRDVMPLIPFFGVGMGMGLFTAWVERKFIGAEGPEFDFTVLDRLLIAGRALWFYLGKLVWPVDLVFIYPRWNVSHLDGWQYLFPAAAMLGLGALVWRRWRGLLAGLLCFAGTLFPALGFFNVYPFRYSFVADHFQYLAGIGPLTLAAAGMTAALGLWGKRKPYLKPVLVGTLLLALGILTRRQCGMYADPETLWRTTITRNPDCAMAYISLGNLVLAKGNKDEAVSDFQTALKIEPDDRMAHIGLGNALMQEGRLDEALVHYRRATEIRPEREGAGYGLLEGVYYDLGILFSRKGQLDEAVVNFQKALKLNPKCALAYSGLGHIFLQKQQWDVAITNFQKALEFNPDLVDAHLNLGQALFQKGQLDQTMVHFHKALEIQPDNVDARMYLAWILATTPDAPLRNGHQAVELAQEANRLSDGQNPRVLTALAAAYAEAGRFSEAVAAARQARRLAVDQSNTDLAGALQIQIGLYSAGAPFRDDSQTNVPPHLK
jgi:tetratricopeptide (TPR) repeat protein